MAITSGSAELFDWLTDEQLTELVVKLNGLPSGREFERRVEEAMTTTVGVNNRTYEEVVDEHGDLIGYVDENESRLPWWLLDFEWTVTSELLDSLTIKAGSLKQFEQYPLDSTLIDDISLTGAQEVSEGLDAFLSLEEQLSSALDTDVAEASSTAESDSSEFELPDKLFVVPEAGRIATSEAFESWFERMLNLCPPAAPEITGLLRVNTNIKRQLTEEALDRNQVQRLTELSVFNSGDDDAHAYNDAYYDPLTALLQIEPPFDLEIEVSNDKDALTDLQYAFYRSWASSTSRMSGEQRWLRGAGNTKSLSEAEIYRFAEYAFRMPLRIDSEAVVFEDQKKYGSSQERQQIAEVLDEHGHPANDD
ncbi:hypothetical protein [Natronosalvus amylolyticus]|uniref:hypothetical protein n=1 Tax=Natronosalvus amylolyticus TaxID=2961994 RepID=UPI0020CA0F23|nr:hypothetical protein [Natronosalvus amylolyticus]